MARNPATTMEIRIKKIVIKDFRFQVKDDPPA